MSLCIRFGVLYAFSACARFFLPCLKTGAFVLSAHV